MSTQQWSARGEVTSLIGFGLFLGALGALLIGLSVRGETGGDVLILLILGGVSAAFGQVMVFIGVIAIGVRLGTRE